MAMDYTRHWIQFFMGCGIPGDVATTYGLIFNENRIQKNMLLDLNKEYLRDMGITVMGDVIAILRHAKIVHDKYIREQILSEPEDKLTVDLSSESSAGKKAPPVKRMLEHYTRKYDSIEPGVPHEKVQVLIENDKNIVTVPKKLAHRIGTQNESSVKKKIESPSVKSDDLAPPKLEVPVPKIRRVLPENEGKYTIKMPSGTTERSKKILEKSSLKHNKTVFDRLGESSVSSTSDVTIVPGTGCLGKTSSLKDKNTLSVFSRLGEKAQLVTSTSSNGDGDHSDQLPYRGILKANSGSKKLQLMPNSTMRADNELHSGKTDDLKLKKTNFIKDRLGINTKRSQLPSKGDSLKINKLQITTTFEEEKEPTKVSSLSKRFKTLSATSEVREKESLNSFKSKIIQNKGKVTSTTQLPEVRHGIKRRLKDTETNQTSDRSEVLQSKKVRFGRTTQRLIPGNTAENQSTGKDYRNFTMKIVNPDRKGIMPVEKHTLTSGVKIGPMSSDKIKQKPSLKDRIGLGLTAKTGSLSTDLKKRRSLKFNSALKKGSTSIHDRLG